MEAIREVAESTREQTLKKLWNARYQLEDVENEISRIKGELQDLEDIDSDYNKAYTSFHNSFDLKTTKLSRLEILADNSNSAKTYSAYLGMEMCSNDALDIVSEFNNIRNIISDKILIREEKLQQLKNKRDNLEYTICRANATLYELENSV